MKKSEYSINKGYITQKVNNKTAIFSGEDSILFTLNGSGALIFNGLKLGWTEEKILEKMITEFEITEDIAKDDIKKFMNILLEKEILIKK